MLTEELKDIVGARGWSDDPQTLEPHLTEWRGTARGRTRLLVSPASTGEVAAVVGACARAGVAVVPQGGNTGLCGGAIPDESGEQVLMSMSRMNRIRQIDPLDFSMIAEAGCVLATLQEAARSANRFFALSLASEGSCQIGGNLSTNAGGTNVIRYGTAREQVLGLEVVLADGSIWDGLRTLRKDTAGYDLKQLFIGSEGTLGVITAAALRLFPDPGAPVTALLALSAAGKSVELLASLRDELGETIQAFELMSGRSMEFVERHIPGAKVPFDGGHPWYVLIDATPGDDPSRFETALMAAIEDGIAADAVIAKNDEEAARLWRLRHSISEAQKREGASLKHDVSVPVGRIGEFLEESEKFIDESFPEVRLCLFGHVGDGNVHYNVSQPEGWEAERFLARGDEITAGIFDLAAALGGSITGEHGIGTFRKPWLARYRGGREIELMRTVKSALDPRNTLNPGKVI